MTLDKRAHHNALERKRRDHIKDSFTNLRDCIPAMSGEKVTIEICLHGLHIFILFYSPAGLSSTYS